MQYFKFPMEFLRVTQGENNPYSHAGSLAMDFGGKDGGSDKLYCPRDMRVVRVRNKANGEMYLESVQPVKFADGTTDYARLLCMHDNSFNFVTGYVIKQGDYFYDEGGMGGGKSGKYANHIHIEAGKGKWESATQSKNKYGTYVIENQSSLYDLFVLGDDVKIIDGGGYKWRTVSHLEKVCLFEEKTDSIEKYIKQLADVTGKLTKAENELVTVKSKNARLEQTNKKLQDKLEQIKKITGG